MINQANKVNRIIALIQDGQEAVVRIPLAVTLPGEVEEFNEPEITVIETTATALTEEIFLEITLQQDTYYVVKETGLVNIATTVHQFTQLLPAAGSQPGHMVQLAVDPHFEEGWLAKVSKEEEKQLTILTGTCRLNAAFQLLAEEELVVEQTDTLTGKALTEPIKIETVHSHFTEVVDLSLPLILTETPDSKVQARAKFINQRAAAMCGWVKVEGEVLVTVSYQLAKRIIKRENYVYPLKKFFEHQTSNIEMDANVAGRTEILTCQLDPAGKGVLRGLLHLSGTLIKVQKIADELRSFTSDSYAPHHYKKHFELEEVVGVGSSQTLIEQEIFFGRKVKFVREPVAAEVRHLQHEIIHNKVIVRGTLHKELFAVEAKNSTVFVHDVQEKFVHFVDVPGAAPGMRAQIAARVEYVRVEVNPDQETARQVAIIEIRVKVLRRIKKDHQPPVKPPHDPWPKPPHYPTPPPAPEQRIYIVRSGDSVWKIAQKFGVSMEVIIAANNLQNPNLIYPGQKLIIPL
ncbi:MAG TPA: LysM peptidoglycan-binding domain-containing protein [Oscillospiraceae bacterium]|nr:LysM peptidoglycan-binding domain-containing protein [Oscillospiraceae bacterium]